MIIWKWCLCQDTVKYLHHLLLPSSVSFGCTAFAMLVKLMLLSIFLWCYYFIAFIITLLIIQNVCTTRTNLCGFLFCKIFQLTLRINSIWRVFLFSTYFWGFSVFHILQEFSGHIEALGNCMMWAAQPGTGSLFLLWQWGNYSSVWSCLLNAVCPPNQSFVFPRKAGSLEELVVLQTKKPKRVEICHSYMTNKNCWAGIINAVFSPGKKKTQEGKNKGKKAADTKQKKTDSDSTSADMRDSKEGEFSNVLLFPSVYLFESKDCHV